MREDRRQSDRPQGANVSVLCSAQKESQGEFDRSTCSDEVREVCEQMAAHRHRCILKMCHVELKKTQYNGNGMVPSHIVEGPPCQAK